MKAVFLDYDTVGPSDLSLDRLRALLPSLECFSQTRHDDIAGRIADAQVVIVNKIQLDAATLDAAKDLRLVCLAATGTDNINLAAAADRGIAVTNIRGYCTPSVVQHVFALILSLTQRLAEYGALLADGAWQRHPHFCMLNFPIRELAGKTLGIVGLGELGRGVALAGRAFGMSVIAAGRPVPAQKTAARDAITPDGVTRAALAQLLADADIVSLHCPLNDATRHLIDRAALRVMRRDALLINTARGALIDSSALVEALDGDMIAGAGIDVLDNEPPANGDPLLDYRGKNLIVTPHIAWAAREARQRALDEIADNIAAFMAGERRNRVET